MVPGGEICVVDTFDGTRVVAGRDDVAVPVVLGVVVASAIGSDVAVDATDVDALVDTAAFPLPHAPHASTAVTTTTDAARPDWPMAPV